MWARNDGESRKNRHSERSEAIFGIINVNVFMKRYTNYDGMALYIY